MARRSLARKTPVAASVTSVPVTSKAMTIVVASGALDRHPGLRLLISEGGASWVPFVADRIEEGYRQHGVWARPKLSRPPREIRLIPPTATAGTAR